MTLRISILSLLVLLALATPAHAQWRTSAEPAPLDLSSYPRADLRIDSGEKKHRFDVWIADTPERQRQGLMWVRDLPADQGMLFINDSARLSYFWMKNTYIPLDMIFVDGRGKIVAIFANVPPLTLDPVGPDVPVKAILELRGGEAAKRGIKPGDRLRNAAFGNAR
jgi:uncharacterized membrane protein (UPF0127 family)